MVGIEWRRARRRAAKVGAAASLLVAVLWAFGVLGFRWFGHWEGIYLLRGDGGIVLADDLYLGDEPSVLAAVGFRPLREAVQDLSGHAGGHPERIEYAWSAHDGTGFVRNRFGADEELLTCFSRISTGGRPDRSGLFVGGRPPSFFRTRLRPNLEETGVAYFNGHRWYHIWCNANEALLSGVTDEVREPPAWEFLGSAVIDEGPDRLVLSSRHRAKLDGVPLVIQRYAVFRAGSPSFLLATEVRNRGSRDACFTYGYGDEPWLGHFGSAGSNVGWVAHRLISTESWVDPQLYSAAGYFDFGAADATLAANFLKWPPVCPPDRVYFSNRVGQHPTQGAPRPLSGNERGICLEWGPMLLRPGERQFMVIAVGMARNDSRTGFPIEPAVNFGPAFELAARGGRG